ncbi:MAG: ferritin family protein [Chloroflexi bacterium]|nr:ferritin family protein [Chloroflexota bacterium]
MSTEGSAAVEALRMAIQMEIDGKEFYLKASRESTNALGQKLLQTLADEEDGHQRKFKEIYDTIKHTRDWPSATFQLDGGKHLRTVFMNESQKIGSKIKALPSELDAVKVAMKMENKTFDFYKSQATKAAHPAEKEFYQAVAAEESEHHLILADYYEYLSNPAAWFVQKEHPSLDGG